MLINILTVICGYFSNPLQKRYQSFILKIAKRSTKNAAINSFISQTDIKITID